jgi:hypothetical protein
MIFSSPPAKSFVSSTHSSFVTSSNFISSTTPNITPTTNLDFIPPSFSTIPPAFQVTLPSSTYNPFIPISSYSSKAFSIPLLLLINILRPVRTYKNSTTTSVKESSSLLFG